MLELIKNLTLQKIIPMVIIKITSMVIISYLSISSASAISITSIENTDSSCQSPYPNSQSPAKSCIITIYGTGFIPSTDTDGYIKDGLAVHLDAINNFYPNCTTANAVGAISHSATTTIWCDISGNGNYGVLCSGFIAPSSCSSAYSNWSIDSLNFNGSTNWVNLPTTSTLLPQRFTLESVVKYTSSDKMPFILKNRVGTTAGVIGIARSDNGLTLLISIDNIRTLTAGILDQLNTTYTFSGTYDGSRAKFQLNNISVIEPRTGTVTYHTDNYPWKLGTNGGEAWLNGKMSSARIYTRALSAQEINQNCIVDSMRFLNPNDSARIPYNCPFLVQIGSADCSPIIFISSTEIKCTAPPQPAGYYALTIDNGIESSTQSQAYQYQDFTITTLSAALTPRHLALTLSPPANTYSKAAQSIAVTTNYRSGYSLKIDYCYRDVQAATICPNAPDTTALRFTNLNISRDISVVTSGTSLLANTYGFTFQTNSLPSQPDFTSLPIRYQTDAPNSTPNIHTLTLEANVDLTLPAGEYTNTLIYSLVAN